MRLAPLVGLAILLGAGCSPGAREAKGIAAHVDYAPVAPLPGSPSVAFTIPRGEAPAFFDLPWPTELAKKADGKLELSRFPGREGKLFSGYVATAEEDLEGFSVLPAIYFHLTGPLPDAPKAGERLVPAEVSAKVMLVDVDPASPERGRLVPLEQRYYPAALRVVPKDTLAVKPQRGVVLRPGTLYAAVLRRDRGGVTLGTSLDLEITKWTRARPDAHEERARALHAQAFAALEELGVGRESVAGIAVFRTQVPYDVTRKMIEAAANLAGERAPKIVSAAWVGPPARAGKTGSTHQVEGIYCTPNFQDRIDKAPFLTEDGGRVRLDAQGTPRVVDLPPGNPYRSAACGPLVPARFILTVPDGPMPAGGWPLLVSAHGTGGDATSFLGRNDFSGWAARQGIAVVSTDQPLHGREGPAPRPGSREPVAAALGLPLPGGFESGYAFYNPIHPGAARDNLRQAAVDAVVLGRLLLATDFAATKGANGEALLPALRGRVPPRFDRDRLLYAGHSQGSQSIAVVGALDPRAKGVLLSGCGGDARLGILKRDEPPIASFLSIVLGLSPGELDEFHPMMALAQTLADPVDPVVYARLYREPLPGYRAVPVLHFEGVADTFVAPASAEALALALGATPLMPVVHKVPGLGPPERDLEHLAAKSLGFRALAQFESTWGENGHFVIYKEADASRLAMEFLRVVSR